MPTKPAFGTTSDSVKGKLKDQHDLRRRAAAWQTAGFLLSEGCSRTHLRQCGDAATARGDANMAWACRLALRMRNTAGLGLPPIRIWQGPSGDPGPVPDDAINPPGRHDRVVHRVVPRCHPMHSGALHRDAHVRYRVMDRSVHAWNGRIWINCHVEPVMVRCTGSLPRPSVRPELDGTWLWDLPGTLRRETVRTLTSLLGPAMRAAIDFRPGNPP